MGNTRLVLGVEVAPGNQHTGKHVSIGLWKLLDGIPRELWPEFILGDVAFGSDTTRRLSFFVMVLCYSHQLYVEFTVSQTMEHFFACHQSAFRAFGGIPARIMVDNLKSVVLKRSLG
jgi:transposase